MSSRTARTLGWLVAVLTLLAGPVPAMAFEPPPEAQGLKRKEYSRPDLYISTGHVELRAARKAMINSPAWNRFFAESGADVQVYIDPRSGTASNILCHIPVIPGSGAGNRLSLRNVGESFGQTIAKVDEDLIARVMRRFVETNEDVLGTDVQQLGDVRAVQVNEDLWHVSIPQKVGGIPVRYARIAATINHGNLVLIGTETWANARIDTAPFFGAEEALAIGFTYAGGKESGDKIIKEPSLEIVPFAPAEYQAGEAFAGPPGQGYGHRLVWSFLFVRAGETPIWEVMVDAKTGELLSFEDTNQYTDEKIVGGVYPLTCTEICPSSDRCGTMQPGSPMPFADTGFSFPNDFANSAGLYPYSSGTAVTTLNGRHVGITDTCGPISESSVTGSIDLGGANGDHDCASGGASGGNTAATRSAFYEVNKLVEQASGWLPGNSWLQGQIPTNVNILNTCNAFYSSSSGSINFFRSGGGCRNTGEIAGVFDHEWGHAMDDNDSNGVLSNSSEAYADIAALYRLQTSCIGTGFFQSIDFSCGTTSDGTGFNADEAQIGPLHCDLDCSGVRDADWDRHADHTPDTPANFTCPRCNAGSGPCGRQVHCAAAPSRQAAWDFVARDLRGPPYNYDASTAFIVGNKIFYQGSGNIGLWHACSCPSSSDGCGAANAYMSWLAADDDDGNLADGTPHMTALFNAFNRHGIACPTPAPVDSGCVGGPTSAPSLTAAIGNNQIALSWTAVPGASTYWVLRSEGFAGCDFGKARIATVAGTAYVDHDVANDRPYSYVVAAAGSTEACYGPASACVTKTPQPCAGLVSLDRASYNCADILSIGLVDSDLAGTGAHDVTIRSTTESTPESVSLTETPPGSGVFKGTFPTTGGQAVGGDGKISVRHDDIITVGYTDASYCGVLNVAIVKTALVDCAGPVISSVHAVNVTGNSADVLWATDEVADSRVVYDTSNPPVASNASKSTLVTSHSVPLVGLQECATYSYSVSSKDSSGNSSADNNGGSYYTFATGKNVSPTFTYPGPSVAINDSPLPPATASIFVFDNKIIQDIDVKINIKHAFDQDLQIRLIAPDSTTILLSNRRGGSGDNFTNTVFDDEAATPISVGSPPFTDSFRPDQPLSLFDGKSAQGTWTLSVLDVGPLDVGTLDNWSITFTYPPHPCGASLEAQALSPISDTCGGPSGGGGNSVAEPGEDVLLRVAAFNNGTSTATGITGRLSTTTPGITITDDSATFPDVPADNTALTDSPHFGFTVDSGVPCGTVANFKVAFTADQGSWSTNLPLLIGPSEIQSVFTSIDVPKAILDEDTITSTLYVPSTDLILDLDVRVSLAHSYDGDLIITLLNPYYYPVVLSNRNGAAGDDYAGTIFDDEASLPITTGVAPFIGRFRPEELLGFYDGFPATGTWTLMIQDAAAIDEGTLLSWSLTVTSFAPPCEVCSPSPAGEVPAALRWTAGSKTTLEWGPATNASFYAVHQGVPGDLPKLLDSRTDSCRRLAGTALTTGPILTDAPPTGSFQWFLVRAGNGAGEGPAGDATAGPRVLNSSGPCP